MALQLVRLVLGLCGVGSACRPESTKESLGLCSTPLSQQNGSTCNAVKQGQSGPAPVGKSVVRVQLPFSLCGLAISISRSQTSYTGGAPLVAAFARR